jgi:hypothetical protein
MVSLQPRPGRDDSSLDRGQRRSGAVEPHRAGANGHTQKPDRRRRLRGESWVRRRAARVRDTRRRAAGRLHDHAGWCDGRRPAGGSSWVPRAGSFCHNPFGSPRSHRFQSLRLCCRESGSVSPARRRQRLAADSDTRSGQWRLLVQSSATWSNSECRYDIARECAPSMVCD